MKSVVKTSVMTGKLEFIPAINTDTTSNSFCIREYQSANPNKICVYCYSHNMLNTFRKNCVPAFKHNSDVLSESELLPDCLPRINSAYFRFNGHGELINETHLINLFAICEKNPATSFALWTKRKNIVNSVLRKKLLPKNLILVYSNPILDKVMTEPPKHFHKVFNNVSKSVYKSIENCTGQKCIECLACYKKDSGTDVIVEKVK